MAKRIILISSFPICIVFAIIALILAGVGRGQLSPNLEKAKVNIVSLIDAGYYTDAIAATDNLINDFPGDPYLAETLYSLTEKFESASRFEDTKYVYQQIVQNCPKSSYAGRATLGITREEVLSLIDSRNYDAAKQAIDKMVIDFAGHQDLPDTLYWIGERYNWLNQFEAAKQVYQQVTRNYPESPWARRAELGVWRAEIFYLIIDSQDYNEAKQDVDKIIVDFKGHPDLPQTLFWIADRYRWWNNRFEEADQVYQQIARIYPDGPLFDNVQLGISKIRVLSFIVAQDYNQADLELDKMIADFNGNPFLPEAVINVANEYYNEAFYNRNETGEEQKEDVKDKFQRAAVVFERIITELPETAPYTIDAWYLTGECHYNSGPDYQSYQTAIEYFEEVVDRWPESKPAVNALGLIGACYDKLRHKGILKDEEADSLIEQTHKELIERYFESDNRFVEYACENLGRKYFKKGQWSDASFYFEGFLQKSSSNDPRRPNVLYSLGRAYQEMGETESAIRIYKESLDSTPISKRYAEEINARIQKLEGEKK